MSKYEPLWKYISYGYEVVKISMKEKIVLFNKIR